MVRNIIKTFVIFLLLTGISAHAGNTKLDNNLLGMLSKLEAIRDNISSNIEKNKSEIRKCNSTIVKSRNLIELAKKTGNIEVDLIASSALAKAKQAKYKNENLINLAQLRKKQIEITIADITNIDKTQSVMISSKGQVDIFSKKLNKSMSINDNQSAFLEDGDEISTQKNSSVEMLFLHGEGTLKLAENSTFKMTVDHNGNQIIDMKKGKIYISVDKRADRGEKIENQNRKIEDKDWAAINKKLLEERKKRLDPYSIKKAYKLAYKYFDSLPYFKKIRVKTPTAILAVRGTKFIVLEDKDLGTQIIVEEGIVDVKALNYENPISIYKGYKVNISKDGIITSHEKIDL